jgi:membrane fusion protein (multidrug efflux system)
MKREAQSRVEGLKISWEQAVRDYERNEKNKGLISESALDGLRVARDRALAEYETAKLAVDRAALDETASRTNVERARIQLERQVLNHSYTRILAPFTGIIASRAIKVGDTVTSGEVLGTGTAAFVLTDPDHLRAVINRPQRELVLFAPSRTVGDTAEGSQLPAPSTEIIATAEALPGFEFDGLIRLVSPSIDAASGNFRVTIAFERPADLDGPWLAPGMLVRLEIVTDRHLDALVVPKRAVRREGDVTLLYLVRDGSAVRVEIAPGFEGQDRLEVVPREPGALSVGDLVVVVGNRDLEPGDAVTLVEDVPGAGGSAVETGAGPEAPTASTDGDGDEDGEDGTEDGTESAPGEGTAADGARGSGEASGDEG